MDAPLLFPQLPLAARPPFYFALRPDVETAARIRTLARNFQKRDEIGGRVYPADRLHLSLCPIGLHGLKRGEVRAAIEVAAEIAAERFTVRFDKTASVRGRGGHCLILRSDLVCTGLDCLATALHRRLTAAGLTVPGGEGAPHLTIIRQTAQTPESVLETPVEWEAGDFVLARLGGSASNDLASWRLGA